MKYYIFTFIFIFVLTGYKQVVFAQKTIVHDPVMIQQDSMYYVFCTGMGITKYASPDMKKWTLEKPVFATAPEWAVQTVPGFKGHIWAPDISFYKGKYYVFYSVSAFGKNTSCIGLAENVTLHAESSQYQWKDHGKIIQSVPGRDNWNAIDPNLIIDEQGHPWLDFGSFWSGIKLVRLADDLSGVAQPEEWFGIAGRPRNPLLSQNEAGDGAIEAPFIVKHDKYYYLFVSFDYCCRGKASNYKIMVGRSEKLSGPYVDKDNKPMTQGGGSLVLAGDATRAGLGHNAVCTFNGKDYILYHAYETANNGMPVLQINELIWDTIGWPVVSTIIL